ncbi:MAG: hypothetical protein LBP89_09335 [Helicobacteraceae bacterium]|jgi:hypothetical protein|nr:hypothetical protein [Helicobacteraceae bacterium]
MKTLILLLQIFCGVMLANNDNCDYFGANIKPIKNAKTYNGVTDFSGDYNGDGIQDRLVFTYLPCKPQFAKDVNVVYMLGDISKPEYREEGTIGLAFILSDKTKDRCKKYIIYDDSFFVSIGKGGMWSPTGLHADFVKKIANVILYGKNRRLT